MSLVLSGDQKRALNEALLEAFRDRDALEVMVGYYLDENLATITSSDQNLRTNVFELVSWAESVGRLDDLVDGARQANAGNPTLEAFEISLHRTVIAIGGVEGQGAKVFVNGGEEGVLPIKLRDLAPGTHALAFDGGDRYARFERSVEITAGQTIDLGVVALEVVKGVLRLDRVTAEARVTLITLRDSQRVERVIGEDEWRIPPVVIELDPDERSTILASKEGLADLMLSVDFEDGHAEKRIRIDLGAPPVAELKGTLDVDAIPPAIVALDGALLGATPRRGIALTAGAHELRLLHPLLGEKLVTVQIEAGALTTSVIAYEPGGTLDLDATPAAKVLLDGRTLGGSPQRGVLVPAGHHVITFVHSDFGTKTVEVEVVAGETKSIVGELVASGTLDLFSDPPAKVMLDGEPLGLTPLLGVSAKAGAHTLTFLHPVLGTKSLPIELAAGESKTARVVYAQIGKLDIRSTPNAKVMLDDKVLGITPQLGVSVSAGEHHLVFFHPLLGKKTRTVQVGAGETMTVSVELDPAPTGKLDIDASSPATITLDGKAIGSTPQLGVVVPAGLHMVTLSHPLFGEKAAKVMISPGETETVKVDFGLGLPGKLNLSSTPIAEVTIDGKLVGTTPQTNVPVSPGTHLLVFSALGQKKKMKVLVLAAETKTVSAELGAPVYGRLS
ncbi:MAG: PEGA domain-containing protein, partial [Minicystis sp.]